ncbi:MAG: AAA family ATPase [Planctomycetaceae bacterium]|nr:AAA family ATPase [Planctomycetaceae bacterium]
MTRAAGQLVIGFAEAQERILSLARAVGPRAVVGVTGAVASGKSTLAQRLSACVVSTDHYLPDYDRTPEHLRDLPESSDLARLARDLAELRAGRATDIPRWTFEAHARVGEQRVEPAEIVVVEGLHALHELPRAHVDVAVFIDAPREVRWARAAERERAGDRPWPLEYLEHYFHTVAEPTYARHEAAYRAAAHVVVVGG